MFGSRKVVGLDIGTSTIKIAELDLRGKSATLLSFGMAPTPVGSINSGEISNSAAISTAIQALKAEIKSRRKKVSTGLWGNSVIVKKISIPKVEKKMIADQIRFEAEQYIPFDINSIHLDYYVLPKSQSPEIMDLILVAAQTEVVMQYSSAVRNAGFEMGVLDVSAFALANAFELNYGKLKGQNIGLLNIGAGVTNFVVLSDGYVIFARDISVGGATYTNELQKEMGISFGEAEALKMSAMSKSGAPEQAITTINHVNETVADEIRNSLDFFSASNIGYSLSKLYVTGGSSGVPGLFESIGRSAQLPVEPLKTFARVKLGNKSFTRNYIAQVESFAAIAIGLGIRQAGDK